VPQEMASGEQWITQTYATPWAKKARNPSYIWFRYSYAIYPHVYILYILHVILPPFSQANKIFCTMAAAEIFDILYTSFTFYFIKKPLSNCIIHCYTFSQLLLFTFIVFYLPYTL